MILKLLSLPFWILSQVLKLGVNAIKLLLTVSMSFLFLFANHLLGAAFGALVGLLFGRKHVGVRFFTHKRKHHHKIRHSLALSR